LVDSTVTIERNGNQMSLKNAGGFNWEAYRKKKQAAVPPRPSAIPTKRPNRVDSGNVYKAGFHEKAM